MSKVLSLINISKSFSGGGGAFCVFNNINLDLAEGEMVALVGPSGSGKSTLLQIAGLIDHPSSGTILVGDRNTHQLSDDDITLIRRRSMGFVFQFHHLLPEFSAAENAAMPLLIDGTPKSDALRKAGAVLEELGLANKYNSYPSEMSGGECQRVAIARALAHNPSIIFADEPTGSLDPENGKLVFDIFYYATKKHRAACLFVTHNLELAKKADRMLTIHAGQLVEIDGKSR